MNCQTLVSTIEAGKFAGLALAQAYMELGTRKLIGKDTPGALAAYDKAVATAPKYGEAYVWRSFGRIELGALAPALDDLSQALTLGLEDRAGGYYLRAEVKAKMKDYPGAIADYDQAIALDQDFGHAYIGRGQARRESGDEAGALADLDHAITGGRKLYHYKNGFRLVPHYAAIFRKLGWAGWNDDTPPDAYLARGRLWLDKADYERARPDLEYAAHHSIDNPDALALFRPGAARDAAVRRRREDARQGGGDDGNGARHAGAGASRVHREDPVRGGFAGVRPRIGLGSDPLGIGLHSPARACACRRWRAGYLGVSPAYTARSRIHDRTLPRCNQAARRLWTTAIPTRSWNG